MNLSDKIAVSDDVVSREVGGEMVLLDLASGTYFGLDDVGARVWALLVERSRTLAELCDTIEAEYEAPRELIETDLIALAADLCERGLIAVEAA